MTVVQPQFPGFKRFPVLWLGLCLIVLACSSIGLQIAVYDTYQQGIWGGIVYICCASFYFRAYVTPTYPSLRGAMAISFVTVFTSAIAFGISLWILVQLVDLEYSPDTDYLAVYIENIFIGNVLVHAMALIGAICGAALLGKGLRSQIVFQNQQMVYTTQQFPGYPQGALQPQQFQQQPQQFQLQPQQFQPQPLQAVTQSQ